LGRKLSRLEGRRLQNERLHGLYSVDEIKYNEMDGTCGTYVERRDSCRVLVDNPEGKKPLEIPKCRWEDNTKTDKDPREHGLD